MPTQFNYYSDRKEYKNKSNYNLSHKTVIDVNFGEIVPHLFMDVIPGDEFTFNPETILKMAPLVAPVTSEIEVNMRLFYVPYRQLFAQFDKFYMGQQSGGEVPNVQFSTLDDFNTWYRYYGRLYSHFGLPQDPSIYGAGLEEPATKPSRINIMPMRAYNSIYFWYYHNQLKYSATENDAIRSNLLQNSNSPARTVASFMSIEGKYCFDAYQNNVGGGKENNTRGYYEVLNNQDWQTKVNDFINITNVNQGTYINELKTGYSLQRFYDNMLDIRRSMKDYTLKMFGISRDTLSDRPLYLGGTKSRMYITDINATTEAAGQPLGTYAGKGFGKADHYSKFTVPEFGYIIGLIDITPKISYAARLHPRLEAVDHFDFYHPELEDTYYDSVPLKNVNMNYRIPSLVNDTVIGYQSPYNDYRYAYDTVHGRMADELNYWSIQNNIAGNPRDLQVGRIHYIDNTEENGKNPVKPFENLWKTLSSEIFAVPSEPQVFIETYNQINAKRILRHVADDFTQ